MSEDFKETILSMTKEFDEKETMVTCEVAVHHDALDEFASFVNDNEKSKLGQWIITECDTCVEYHGEGYRHVSLEKPSTIEKIKKASNYIRVV